MQRKRVSSGSPVEPMIGFSRAVLTAIPRGEVFSAIRPAGTFVEVKGPIDPLRLVELQAGCVAETGSGEAS